VRIREVLRRHSEIEVAKAEDTLAMGLHWYNFNYFDKGFERRVRGSGTDFSDAVAICRTWGEFVERYSFFACAQNNGDVSTSNGFASHVTPSISQFSALRELIERDVVLSSWLLGLRAIKTTPQILGPWRGLERLGVNYKIGILGECMGTLVGIGVIYSSERLGFVSSAKTSISELQDQIFRELAHVAFSWNSKQPMVPIDTLPENAAPEDHARFYLNKDPNDFIDRLFASGDRIRSIPSFSYRIEELTLDNNFALESNFVVHRAFSPECQRLWFGPTLEEHVNLARISQIAGRKLSYDELNHDTQPLP